MTTKEQLMGRGQFIFRSGHESTRCNYCGYDDCEACEFEVALSEVEQQWIVPRRYEIRE